MRTSRRPPGLLVCITLSQLLCCSLWFAVNGALASLQQDFALAANSVGPLTSAIQLGFIAGTLVSALFLIADRFRMQYLFVVCALAGAVCNLVPLWLPREAASFHWILLTRFATGFFLAGIYPIGMKIASSWYREGLGWALGWLVGALVIATGLPHLLRASGSQVSWSLVLQMTSMMAVVGALLIALLAPDGPFNSRATRIDPRALSVIVSDPRVRASAFGYFGHMWELYAMLTLIPAIIAAYLHTGVSRAVSFFTFVVFLAGGLTCFAGGYFARRVGSARVASAMLAISGFCALISPWVIDAPWWLFAGWLLVWGATVGADSPQFSSLTAINAPPGLTGSVLTFVNCIGFSISIVTIQWTTSLSESGKLFDILPLLAIGPVLGLIAMRPLLRTDS